MFCNFYSVLMNYISWALSFGNFGTYEIIGTIFTVNKHKSTDTGLCINNLSKSGFDGLFSGFI